CDNRRSIVVLAPLPVLRPGLSAAPASPFSCVPTAMLLSSPALTSAVLAFLDSNSADLRSPALTSTDLASTDLSYTALFSPALSTRPAIHRHFCANHLDMDRSVFLFLGSQEYLLLKSPAIL